MRTSYCRKAKVGLFFIPFADEHVSVRDPSQSVLYFSAFWWGCSIKRRYIKCPLPITVYFFYLPITEDDWLQNCRDIADCSSSCSGCSSSDDSILHLLSPSSFIDPGSSLQMTCCCNAITTDMLIAWINYLRRKLAFVFLCTLCFYVYHHWYSKLIHSPISYGLFIMILLC